MAWDGSPAGHHWIFDWKIWATLLVVIVAAISQLLLNWRRRRVEAQNDSVVHEPEAKIVYFVRHGEALHNVLWDWSIVDPHLTAEGEQQAAQLARNVLLHNSPVELIVVSPLCRTLKTAFLGFGHLKSKATWLIEPDIQEKGDVECNRTTAVRGRALLHSFGDQDLLDQYAKLSHENQELRPNFSRFTAMLHKRPESTVIVVTHDHVLANGLGLAQHERFDRAEVRRYELTREGTWTPLYSPCAQSFLSTEQYAEHLKSSSVFAQSLQQAQRARNMNTPFVGLKAKSEDKPKPQDDSQECQPEAGAEDESFPGMDELLAQLDHDIQEDEGLEQNL